MQSVLSLTNSVEGGVGRRLFSLGAHLSGVNWQEASRLSLPGSGAELTFPLPPPFLPFCTFVEIHDLGACEVTQHPRALAAASLQT